MKSFLTESYLFPFTFPCCYVYISKRFKINTTMKIPGLSFSLNRALGITRAKQNFARATGIPTSKAGLERKVGKMVINAILGKKR